MQQVNNNHNSDNQNINNQINDLRQKIFGYYKTIKYELSTYSFRAILQIIIEAIKGNNYNFTQISLKRAFVLLAIPMVIEMLMESVFAIVDIFFVSKLGADAVATVGLTESIMTIIYSIAMGIGVASLAIISRRIGENNHKEASHVAFQAIIVAIIASAVITIPGLIFSKDILRIMGANDNILNHYSGYIQILLGFNVVVFLLFVINFMFRGAGDAAVTLKVLVLSNFLNIVLCPMFIFGIGPFPEMGIEGAATATVIGRSIGVLLQIWILASGKVRIKLLRDTLKIDFKIIMEIIRLSVGSIGQNIIAMTSWIFLMRLVSSFGSTITAGYTIALRILFFILMPSFGISNASATLVGQSLGAGKPDRAVNAVKIGCAVNTSFMGIFTIIIFVFSEFWISLFINDSGVISHGAFSLKIISLGMVCYGLGTVFVHSINGAGDTKTPTKINILIFWVIELPLAYSLAYFANMEADGVYFAILIAETIFTILSGIVFFKGKWKKIVL